MKNEKISLDNHHLKYANFRRIDLNLLVAFDALMMERHVGKAAARMFIGQPAMSHALSRLRETLNDEVFIRSGNKMEPTALALELAPNVRCWLEEANSFLFARNEFDLAQVHTTLKLATVGGIESALLPALVAALRSVAPGIRIWTQMLQRDEILAALDAEEIDMAVGPSHLPFKEWHQHETIYQSSMVCVYSTTQLSLPELITAEILAPLEHVTLSWRSGTGSEVDEYFKSRGLQRNIVITATSQLAVMQILNQFPMVSLQTDLITGAYRDMPEITVRPFIADGLTLDASIIWHRRNEKQTTQIYIRNLIKNILNR